MNKDSQPREPHSDLRGDVHIFDGVEQEVDGAALGPSPRHTTGPLPRRTAPGESAHTTETQNESTPTIEAPQPTQPREPYPDLRGDVHMLDGVEYEDDGPFRV